MLTQSVKAQPRKPDRHLETGLHFHTFRSNAYTHVFTIQTSRFARARILDQSKNTAVFQSTLQSEGEDVVSERLTNRI